MNTYETEVKYQTQLGIACMELVIRELQQRIAQWEQGITHTPRHAIEQLSEVALHVGAIEALKDMELRQIITERTEREHS